MLTVVSNFTDGYLLRPAPLAIVDPALVFAPLYSSWDVFYHHQIWAQSLEAMAVIVLESVGRISEFCMHVACDFTGGAVHYTIPTPDRRLPIRLSCSRLYLQPLNAVIIQTALYSSHSTLWDNVCSHFCPFHQQVAAACFFSSSTSK